MTLCSIMKIAIEMLDMKFHKFIELIEPTIE